MKKFILILIAIILYLAVGINQAKFQKNAFNKHPEEKSLVERVITLQAHSSFSEQAKVRYMQRYKMNQEEVVAFEDSSFINKSFYVLLWGIFYLLVIFTSLIAFLFYAKWSILILIAMALYSNFGYWLGGYVYDKSINEPNFLTKFLEVPKNRPFDWVTAVNNDSPTKYAVELLYAWFWPFFFVYAITAWCVFSVYKFIEIIYKTIKGILWLIFAGPARDGWSKD